MNWTQLVDVCADDEESTLTCSNQKGWRLLIHPSWSTCKNNSTPVWEIFVCFSAFDSILIQSLYLSRDTKKAAERRGGKACAVNQTAAGQSKLTDLLNLVRAGSATILTADPQSKLSSTLYTAWRMHQVFLSPYLQTQAHSTHSETHFRARKCLILSDANVCIAIVHYDSITV